MGYYLGIDGGGTGCRAALADARGRIIGRGEAGPANINTDVEGAARHILAATAEALQGSTIRPADLVAALGLAGGGMSEAVARLAPLLPFARAEIVNDAVTAARGALGNADGIIAAIGTGSVFALQRGGTLRQVGGRGFLMGDQGSGAVLGRQLLADAMRAGDGLLPMTPLLAGMLDDHGGIEGIIAFGNRARPADFAALVPRLLAAADADTGDQAAQRILDAATAEIGAIIATLQEGAALPVVFLGGLGPHFAARLADAPWPIRPPLGSGLDGAVLMARRMGGHV